MVRWLNNTVVSLFYRRSLYGTEHIPQKGGALFVINHISLGDPSLVMASIPRAVRFLMYRPFYEHPVVNFFAKRTGAIPIATEDPPKKIITALSTAREALKNGECVGIFAEGALTRIGNLLPFSKGFEKIMKGVSCPIIPVHIDAMWGSFFSHRGGKPLKKLPGKFPYPLSISFGAPLPPSANASEVRQAVLEMGAEAFARRSLGRGSLGLTALTTAKRFPFRKAISDSSGASFRYGSLLGAALTVASRIRTQIAPLERVGVILPPSVAAALVNFGLILRGSVPVNLNYTASKEALDSAATQCQLKTVITSKEVLSKVPLPAGTSALLVEDLLARLHIPTFINALLGAALPVRILKLLYPLATTAPTYLATVLFSSGSTGQPKGVMLSHKNILSNVTALSEVFQLKKGDCILGVLPFFHSFGFTATLWLPLISGIHAVYHKNPIDAGTIGELVERHKSTILLTTPTFLAAYQRKITPEQFKTVRHAVVGAEKLNERLATSFKEKFGIEPMEGYGCTELSPVAMLNVRNYEDKNVTQTGHKPGTVGHPIPGVTVRVVNPETFEPLPSRSEGLLLVRGANVMVGYLNNPEKTKEVIKDGWYITGDIVRVDEDGFITITDRLSRFSKIGGEMVPHVKIEEAIHSALKSDAAVCVVTSTVHPTKGEQLVVLHTIELDSKEVTKLLMEQGLPNLWIPKRENFFKIDGIPMLASGKVDLKRVKETATTFVSPSLD